MMKKPGILHLNMHLLFCFQRSELEMYVNVAKCISEMADSEIDRIVQISQVIMFYSWSFTIKLCETSMPYHFYGHQSVLAHWECRLSAVHVRVFWL